MKCYKMNNKSKNIKIHSIKYNFIMNIILNISSLIFPLITFPYVSHVLLPEGNGKIAFASSVIYYFSSFAMLGIPIYGISICAKARDNKKELSKTVQELLIINIFMTIIVYIVFFIMLLFIENFQKEEKLLLINSITILLTTFGVEWFYQAIEQYGYITYRNIAFKIISVILMFILVKSPDDYIIYGAISVFAAGGSNVLNIINLRKKIYIKPIGSYNFKRHIKPILILFAMSFANIIYTSLDTVMLGFMSNNNEVGYYAAAVKIKSILVNITFALGTVLMPRVSYYIKNNMINEYNRILKKSFKFSVLFSLPIVIYFIFMAETTILFLAGDKYYGAIMATKVICPVIFFAAINVIYRNQIFIPNNNEKYTMYSTIFGAVINILLNLFLIPKFGAAGAAFATLASEIVVLIVHIKFDIKTTKSILRKINFRPVIISIIISTIVLFLVSMIEIRGLFIKLIITAVIFFGVYLVLLILQREEICIEISANILGKFGIGSEKK